MREEAAVAPASPASALLIVGTLAVLLAAYAIASVTPGMWLWGVELGEFVPMPIAFITATLWGLGLIAATIEVASAGRDRPGILRAPEGRDPAPMSPRWLPWAGGAALALSAAALCALLPDRASFTGDLLLRKGLIASTREMGSIISQAMPLDRALFVDLPRALVGRFGFEPYDAARLLGVVQAGLLGLIGWAFARSLGLSGVATLSVAALATFQPVLALCTGYAKPLSALALLTAAAFAASLNVARGRRGLLALALAVSAALALHRSGLALLPLWIAGCALAWRHARAASRAPGPAFWLAVALPILTLAVTLPAALAAMRAIDAQHFAPGAARDGASALLRSPGWLDRLNVVLVIAPLAPLLPLLAWATPSLRRRRAELMVAGAALAPQLLMLVLIHPRQGLFRDWDVFAAAGAALTIAVAWLAAEALRAPRRRVLAFALAVSAVAPTVAWLAMWNRPAGANARIEAWLAGPPAPDPTGAASAWSFLAQERARTGRWDAAGEAYAHATELAPNPRTFVEWGMAEAMRGDHQRATELYARAAALDSNLTNAWLGLAASSSWLDHPEDVRRAAREIERLAPGHPRLADIDAYLARATPADRVPDPPVALAHPARSARRHATAAVVPADSLNDVDFEFGPTLAAPHGGSTPGEGANPNPR